jgi:hypothetical protein
MEEPMRKQIILTTLIASLASVCAAEAQEPRDFSLLATQTVQLPGTTYSIVFNSPELQVGEPRDMRALSVAIGSWLSANFGLPTMHRPPRIEYVPASEIAIIRSPAWPVAESAAQIPSLYDAHSQTIFLPEGSNGSTPTELSVFVEEMTRHLLNEARYAYHCTPDSEHFVLAVQRRWLAMFSADGQMVNAAGANGPASSPRCVSQQSQTEH